MTHRQRSSWRAKFSHAFRGVRRGIMGQSSFRVHLPAAIVVLIVGFSLPLSRTDLAILCLCITGVLAAELMNSALESLAQAITREHDPRIADALDIASGAVLVTAIGAAWVGSIVLLLPLLRPFSD